MDINRQKGTWSTGRYSVTAVVVVHVVLGTSSSGLFAVLRWSEGFALTGYDIPGCMEDGARMLWENSSVAVVVVAVAHPGWGGGQEFGFSPEIKSCARRGA